VEVLVFGAVVLVVVAAGGCEDVVVVVVVDVVPQDANIMDKASVQPKIRSVIFPFILSPFSFNIYSRDS
jgi:hypothetical protein